MSKIEIRNTDTYWSMNKNRSPVKSLRKNQFSILARKKNLKFSPNNSVLSRTAICRRWKIDTRICSYKHESILELNCICLAKNQLNYMKLHLSPGCNLPLRKNVDNQIKWVYGPKKYQKVLAKEISYWYLHFLRNMEKHLGSSNQCMQQGHLKFPPLYRVLRIGNHLHTMIMDCVHMMDKGCTNIYLLPLHIRIYPLHIRSDSQHTNWMLCNLLRNRFQKWGLPNRMHKHWDNHHSDVYKHHLSLSIGWRCKISSLGW